MSSMNVEASRNTDALLQQSRRVDWRFLLPSPRLGRIAYLVADGEPLLQALTNFCESVTRLDASSRETGVDPFDGLVMKQPATLNTIERFSSLVKPDGFVYIELGKPWTTPLSARKVSGVLQRCGYTDVRRHWHWPNFERCTRFIPLDQPAPLSFDLSRQSEGQPAHWKAWVGHSLIRSGVAGRLAPAMSVLALRGTAS